MNKEKPDSIFNQISSVLDSLGRLADKGQQLKQAVDEANRQSPPGAQQQLSVQTEETDSGWRVKLSAADLASAEVDLKVEDDRLYIKVIKGRDIEYRDVQLESGARIDTVNLDNIAGCINVHCCQ